MSTIISAKEAKKLVSMYKMQKEWDDYAWNRLFTQIEATAKAGKTYLEFYETSTSYFHEEREKVKERLENLGYSVHYERFLDMDKYYINWED